jgi:hypothetical protein
VLQWVVLRVAADAACAAHVAGNTQFKVAPLLNCQPVGLHLQHNENKKSITNN